MQSQALNSANSAPQQISSVIKSNFTTSQQLATETQSQQIAQETEYKTQLSGQQGLYGYVNTI